MQIHQLKLSHRAKRSKRVGRGGKRGTYAGRGIKGQRARAGARIRPAEREIVKKIPKLRGYRFKSFKMRPHTLAITDLDRSFENGVLITPRVLVEKNLAPRTKGRLPRVKILGQGETKKKFTFTHMLFSASAAKKLNRETPIPHTNH